MQVTERFTNRVGNYVKYRPGYPREVLDFLQNEYGLNKNSVIADIGAGTGISAKFFLEIGCKVFGVEPNDAMREAAEVFLQGFPTFTSVKGMAEATNLADNSIDFVVAAQAFHWFEREKTQPEFRRTLCESGIVCLIWNERETASTEFLREYEKFLLEFGTDYKEVRHDNATLEKVTEFFADNFRQVTFRNAQSPDFEGLKGRLLSSSYTPDENHPRFNEMLIQLKNLFNQFEKDGKVEILYNTQVFIGKF